MSYHVILSFTLTFISNQFLYTTFCRKIHTDFDTISNGQAERRQVSELSSALERLQQEQLGEASAIATFLEHFFVLGNDCSEIIPK